MRRDEAETLTTSGAHRRGMELEAPVESTKTRVHRVKGGTMKALFKWTLVSASLLTYAATASAWQASQQMERATERGVQKSQLTSMTATVQKIDLAHRNVTLQGAQGRMVTVEAGPEVKNLDKIHVGDRVDVAYYESLALNIRKPGEEAPQMGTQEQIERKAGGSPRGTMERQTTVSAEVVSVDAPKRRVTVRSPDGNIRAFDIKSPALVDKLSSLKAGDHVDLTYTESLAVSIQPAK
jgi:hypothetical protein